MDVRDLALHLARFPDVTHLPGHEAFLAVVHAGGIWNNHTMMGGTPSWVWSDNEEEQRLVGDFYDIPQGRPDGIEDTHHTRTGPPGVIPTPWDGITMLKVNSGNDMQARQMGGALVGLASTTTSAPTVTTVTDSGQAWTTDQWKGQRVIMGSNVWMNITSNTASVLTGDRWYAPATPGGAAATTPSTGAYMIIDGAGPAWFMGLTANSAAAAATDTTLTGEIVTAGGGLIRKICPYAHTASAASYTLTPVFTANGSDTLPVTAAKIGVFNSLTGALMLFETLLSATVTFAASGDNATVTETVSL
jgi:hypothetical protein